MDFPIFELNGWGKRSGIQPKTIYSEVPKIQMGTNPRSFINYHKIEAAKKLLLDGQSVTDTAMELSFSSSNYFSAVFRRYTSLSPTEYVKRKTESP